MKRLRMSLTAKMFTAIAATAVLVVAIMALLVASSMRDGFSQYVLTGELAQFDDLAGALGDIYDPEQPDWPELQEGPVTWSEFVRLHLPLKGPHSGMHPLGPPPPELAAGPMMVDQRLTLSDAHGRYIAGAPERQALFKSRRICSADPCDDTNIVGYLGLNAPAFDTIDNFFLRGQYKSLALAALIAVLISAAAAFLVARQLLDPIKRLEGGAKTLAAGDYTARMVQDRTDELGQLIGHFNALAATLQQTEQAERAWISNTSHELQTPLAVLRAQIEALQDGIRKPDRKTLAQMHSALMRLSRLVQDIKVLSHAKESGLGPALGIEDLSEIARDAAAQAQPRLKAKDIHLATELEAASLVICDRVRIGQVIDNLLQNAERYTDSPGHVLMTVEHLDGTVQLTIQDTPPTVPQDIMPKIFDRFFRAEGSRSRAFGGSGLGLAVCKAIVEAHQGRITAQQSLMGGIKITVTLPEANK
ncbi:ATP-binding protein [Paracoccus sp. JM45]|uniref:ATP-binding protein n=1 Tax=Paracoccus sp. JM45 TaxID=2283626 RepID=UPI000E6CB2BE|nr:ATP-binding protein [Paracoccus sp. JM45]RJE79633.1 HAMP domain-containing protein [Paracoccus sp. JM45]